VGCILGELYYLVEGAVKLPGKKQMALFPGRFTDGLSPNAHNSPWAGDQLNTIVNVIGTPDLQNLRLKGNKKLADKLSHMPPKRAIPLADILPWVPEDALHLIGGLLNFAPEDRCTALEAIQHPFVANNVSREVWDGVLSDIRGAKMATIIEEDVDKLDTETTAHICTLVEAEADFHKARSSAGLTNTNKRQKSTVE
jgi:serine/threonine protein kinase